MKSAFRCLIVLLAASVIGCAPRGESKSVSELLAESKARYAQVNKDGLDAAASKALADLTAKLEVMEKASDAAGLKASAKSAAQALAVLNDKAGYTQRPAIGELTAEFRGFGQNAAPDADLGAASKLLVSRTYMLLAAELETMKFKLG